MVSVPYIKEILTAYGISQADLSKKWTELRKDGKTKHQSNISTVMSRDYTDSLTFIKAVSELSGVLLKDIVDEVSFSSERNSITYNIREDHSGVVSLPIEKRGEEQGRVSIPERWMRPGVNKIIQISSSSMFPNFYADDYVGAVLVNESKWDEIKINSNPYLIFIKGEFFIARISDVNSESFSFSYDHPDKHKYPDFLIGRGDVDQIWEVWIRFSWRFPSPEQTVEDRVSNVESDLRDIRKVLSRFIDKEG